MADVLFHGGPCDGLHTLVDDREVTGATVTCGGATYDLRALGEGEYLATAQDTTTTTTAPTAVPLDGGVLAAWQHNWRLIGRTVPYMVNDTTKVRAAIRRLGMR